MIPFPQVRMVHPALNYLLDPVQVGVLARQGPRFSRRMVIGIFCSDTVFVQLNQFSQILSRQCCLALASFKEMIST